MKSSVNMHTMLKIRLQRVGRKNIPTFRVVLTDSKNSTKSGRFLEVLGSYDTRDDKNKKVDLERVKYWISKGAKLSGTLHNFLVGTKAIEGKKINVLPKKRPIKKEEIKKEAVPETAAALKTESPGNIEKVEEKAAATETAATSESEPSKEVTVAEKKEEAVK